MTNDKDTDSLDPESTNAFDHMLGNPAEPPVLSDDDPVKLPDIVQLEFGKGKNARKLKITLNDTEQGVILGRADERTDCDLTTHGAFEHGVSRLHAAFHRRPNGIFIEDLASTNGTRINGFNLKPHRAYRLRNGDELEIARLRVTLRFLYTS